jgi:hypothetical protein
MGSFSAYGHQVAYNGECKLVEGARASTGWVGGCCVVWLGRDEHVIRVWALCVSRNGAVSEHSRG